MKHNTEIDMYSEIHAFLDSVVVVHTEEEKYIDIDIDFKISQ